MYVSSVYVSKRHFLIQYIFKVNKMHASIMNTTCQGSPSGKGEWCRLSNTEVWHNPGYLFK